MPPRCSGWPNQVRFLLTMGLGIAIAGLAQAGPLEPRQHSVRVRHQAVSEVPVIGPRHAAVTIDFFLGLRSRHSLTLHQNLLELTRRHPRRVRIVYRFVSGGGRTRMAEAAMEAFAQGRFVAFLNQVVAAPDSRLPHRKQALIEVCARAGVDFRQIEEAWKTGRHLPILDRNTAFLFQRHADRTPSLLLNGKTPKSPRLQRLRLSDLEVAYDETYQAAQRMLADGVALEHVYYLSLHRIDATRRPTKLSPGAVDGGRAADIRETLERAPRLRSFNPGPGNAIGPASAPVRLLVYCNFASTSCAHLRNTVSGLVGFFPSRLRVIYYPMFHADLDGAALRDLLLLHRAGQCADAQGAFWPFQDTAYRVLLQRRRRSSRPLPAAEHLDAVIARIELDRELYDSCMSDSDKDERTMEQVRAARKAGIQYSPTLVVGGRIYPGSKSDIELRSLIEVELMPGLLEQFVPTWPHRAYGRDDSPF